MNPKEMEKDLCQWGEGMEMTVKGLSALGFPSGQAETPSGAGVPVPDYFPRGQINALNSAIHNLESKYKNILIYLYACKLNDAEIGRTGECNRGTVKDRLKEAKQELVKSRYWKA